MSIILKQLASSNYISVNKSLIKVFGLTEAVLLGELCSEYDYWEKNEKLEDGMFYSSVVNIEENTGLSDYQQRQAIQSLKNCGVLEVEVKGLPATRYFRINENKLLSYLRTSSEETKELDVKKLNLSNKNISNKNKKKKSIINNTTTTENEFEFGRKKKPKQNLYDKCYALICDLTDDIEIQQLLIQYLNMQIENHREKGTTLYSNVFKGKLRDLERIPKSDWKVVISRTLEKGWTGFYSLDISNKRFSESSTIRSSAYYDEDYIEEDNKKMAEREKNGQRTKF